MFKVNNLGLSVHRRFAASLTLRSINREEQDQIRAARAKFFQVPKRKESTTHNPPVDNKATASTIMPSEPSSKRFKFLNMSRNKASSPDSPEPETPLIIAFYDPTTQAEDARGRTLAEMLSWNDGKLESCHNYIQMLFPLPEGSPFNWEAPIVNREVFDAFRAQSELRQQLKRSFMRMLHFYGFEIVGAAENEDSAQESLEQPESEDQDASIKDPTTSTDVVLSIVRAPDWQKPFRNWAIRFDHNHLRMTRIIRSLRVLGLEAEASAFFKALEEVYNDPDININLRSMTYWRNAMGRPLHTAPDGEQSEWLWDWEMQEKAAREAQHTNGEGVGDGNGIANGKKENGD
ncbi:hypothetical protein IQ07DRAFT_5527 [Pyrenochaeta sp. DS3sAY3a]|nr:hypothetical protein IQ07DRAFT_5527 [Pyrenochaeta sp. DS3sAY3a]